MFRTLIAPLTLAAALALGAGAASADSFRYVKEGVNLNARSGPGSNYATRQVLKPGSKITVVKQQGSWAQIKTTEGLLLWVFNSYLMDQAPKAQPVAAQQQAKPQQQKQQQAQQNSQQPKPQQQGQQQGQSQGQQPQDGQPPHKPVN